MSRPRATLGIYCPGAGTGGPWRYVHAILAGIDPAEFAVTVFCDLPGPYGPAPWVKVVRLAPDAPPPTNTAAPVAPAPTATPARRSLVPAPVRLVAGFLKEARRVAATLRPHPVDLFHTQNTGGEESPLAARLAGTRRVLGTFHVDSTYDLHNSRGTATHRLLETVSNQCLDAAIAVSHATKRDWVRRTRVSASRVTTIHNGIDAAAFSRRQSVAAARRELGVPPDALVLAGVGRLDEAKGFGDLIAALPALLAEFPTLTLLLAGDGPLRPTLAAQAARLGLADRVRFLGFRADVQPVFDAADLFVLPSLCETLGYAFLEAMATELPCVGTRVGGVPEVIVPGETGLLVPPRDPVSLGQAVAELLRAPDARRRMGEAGRRRVTAHFAVPEMVSRTVALYRELLAK